MTYDSLRECKATNTALNDENRLLNDTIHEQTVSAVEYFNNTNSQATEFDELISRIDYMRCAACGNVTTPTPVVTPTRRPVTTPSVSSLQIDTPMAYTPPDPNRHLVETLHEAFELARSKP